MFQGTLMCKECKLATLAKLIEEVSHLAFFLNRFKISSTLNLRNKFSEYYSCPSTQFASGMFA